MKKLLFVIGALLMSAALSQAAVRLPQIFQSGMVLQRGQTVRVWGQADPQEQVVVRLNKTPNQPKPKAKNLIECTVQADTQGKWMAELPAMKAGGPYTLIVESKAEVTSHLELTDVWVGDVWLCSGQSNMETTLERVSPQYPDELNDSNNMVRLFHVQYQTDTRQPSADLTPTSWKPLNRDNAWRFSAIGYFLGKQLQKEKGVAQGIIESAWGGTPIEAWISADTIKKYYPVMHRQTMLYQNDAFIQAQQRAGMLAGQRWQEILDQNDPGMGGSSQSTVHGSQSTVPAWAAADFDDSQWPEVNQYNLTAKPSPLSGRREWIGSLWLRQHITISKAHAGKPAKLLLGTLYDADVTYINGVQVGSTGYQYPPRRYQVPEGLLREGDNVITVRFTNKNGIPYFVKEKPYRLVFGDNDIHPLGQQWKLQTGLEMPRGIGGGISLQNQPSTLFNGMISPMAPFAVAGVLWYQGESNTDPRGAREYAPMLRLLMANWRQAFQRPDLPFVIIQLANYMEPSEKPQNTGWSQVREAQRIVANEDPRAELSVTIDLGETVDIHPLTKKDVAQRVALCLDRLVYGKQVLLSPQVTTATVENGKVILTLDQPMRPVDSSQDDSLKYFEVASSDGKFMNATARLEGNNRIVIDAPVSEPRHLRYAWKDNPLGVNVYSAVGLPLAPFELQLP
jgi:sialate O-acetylesterase